MPLVPPSLFASRSRELTTIELLDKAAERRKVRYLPPGNGTTRTFLFTLQCQSGRSARHAPQRPPLKGLSASPCFSRSLSPPYLPPLNLLRAMREHAKEFGTAPNLAPLDPENFHSSRGRRAALINDLIRRVTTRRFQFLHKSTHSRNWLLTSARLLEPASSSSGTPDCTRFTTI